jgi:ribose transport system substrate-binding protein
MIPISMKNNTPRKSILVMSLTAAAAAALVFSSCTRPAAPATGAQPSAPKKEYKFVIVPKVVHPWFDQVNEGAKKAAAMIEQQTGSKVSIDYRAPQSADVVVQNEILERSISTNPSGIALDLLDPDGNRAVIDEALKRKIPVVVFDSEPPSGLALTSVGGDFAAQAEVAAERLAKLLNYEGEVAIMQGVPTAPNHRIRAETHRKVFAKYPKMKVVAEGVDNDDIERAQKEAAAIISAHPNLKGWVACDAAGPIGVGIAIREANKTGSIVSVGLDDLSQLIELIKSGVVESSSASRPQMQGYWSVIALWQQSLGIPTPGKIDTGVKFITKEMAQNYDGL